MDRIERTATAHCPEQHAQGDADDKTVIPITVRQLEALVRLSESLAKMRLDSEVQPQDIEEALRLFRVSTMAANAVDNRQVTGGGEAMERAERFLRQRLTIGATLNQQRLLEEAAAQGHNAMVVAKGLHVMVVRGEVQERNQGRLIRRVK